MVQLVKSDGRKRPLYVVEDAVLVAEIKPVPDVVIVWSVCGVCDRPVIECGCWQEKSRACDAA